MPKSITLELTGPERDIIIAALRLWQSSQRPEITEEMLQIAEENGPLLSDDDIDALIEEKINV